MTRQNYYKQRRVRAVLAVDESLALSLIGRERSLQPRLGARKLLVLVGAELASAGVSLGRDRFFALLSRHNLLIQRPRRGVRTTYSRHGLRVYGNLARDMTLTAPHQLWVSDITYIRTLEGFMFLSLVMDSFSRAIVGYDCSDSLEREGALRALSMAQRQLPACSITMHHSDRGSQYCCGAYIQRLKKRGIIISMTEDDHCAENSQAERLNGILKQEFGLGRTFANKRDVSLATKEAVQLYNHRRPHGSLGNRVPMAVHRSSASGEFKAPGLRPCALNSPEAEEAEGVVVSDNF
jgi:transposase InsO family protein